MSNADQYTLETPENIEVEFEVAGLGSRFCAMLIDTLVLGLMMLMLIVLAAVLGLATLPSGFEHRFQTGPLVAWLLATLAAIAMALISGGYFILFELLMHGQTPGKKAMKLRVIRDDGTPVTANEVLLRNILRVVDFLPFGYALGAAVMFPNPLCKRLGDLAAGTIVVKEGQLDYRADADKTPRSQAVAVTVANAELTAEERRVLTGFLQRRSELLLEARLALAQRLAGPLHAKYAGHYDDAEGYLERLAEGRHYEA
jgi:uncharacterized RDD family membrane protein YckC